MDYEASLKERFEPITTAHLDEIRKLIEELEVFKLEYKHSELKHHPEIEVHNRGSYVGYVFGVVTIDREEAFELNSPSDLNKMRFIRKIPLAIREDTNDELYDLCDMALRSGYELIICTRDGFAMRFMFGRVHAFVTLKKLFN
jgi:hypothetical protein